MTLSEENYLKAIYHLSKETPKSVTTNALARVLKTKASSVTDMIKRLAQKQWVVYKPYQGVELSEQGQKSALKVIRKHRLWEVFLVEKLNFSWDEVHEVAEQLEHIQSDKLVEQLDLFLQFPDTDPHGDPIPDKNGNMPIRKKLLLNDLRVGEQGYCIGVKNTSSEFLQYLDRIDISIGKLIKVVHYETFDNSIHIITENKEKNISALIAKNIFVKKDV